MLSFQRILLPTDFSELAAPARDYAVAMAEASGAELHLLHIVESAPPLYPDYGGSYWADYVRQAEEKSHARLGALLDADWTSRHPVVSAVRRGTAYVEVLKYAEEQAIDLIVMSTHGRTGLSHAMLGSVAERVVRGATCPVLTIRPQGQPSAKS